jgi:hypothetical protein
METNVTKKFQWLLGVWKARDGRSLYEEWWQKDEYIIDGFRYVLKHGEKLAQEKFRLLERGDTVHYLIFDPKTTRPIDLKMNYFDENMAVFENPAKTFPIFVRYKLKPNGQLEVISDGLRQDGKSYRVQYPFEQVSGIQGT